MTSSRLHVSFTVSVLMLWSGGRICARFCTFMLVLWVASMAAAQDCPTPGQYSGPTTEVTPADARDLGRWVRDAQPGQTFIFADGTYDLSGDDSRDRLQVKADGVVLRSASGDPASVILDGAYGTSELITIFASDVVVEGLTVQRARDHPIHVTGAATHTIYGVVLRNLIVLDPGQQAIKINSNGDHYADCGLIEDSRLELTDSGRAEIRNNCYTGGIDAHKAWGWQVRGNQIEGFWCSKGLSEHAVHFWNGSRDTVVERNTMHDNARGVGFGLREEGPERIYDPDPYPDVGYIGHYDGVIRDNFISASRVQLFASEFGFDAGIALEQARGTKVEHNTVASTVAPFSSIEWRFGNTDAVLANNLVSHNLRERNGAQASLVSNRADAPLDWFFDVGDGDLHLLDSATQAIGKGTSGYSAIDIDGDERPGPPDFGPPDIGADQACTPSELSLFDLYVTDRQEYASCYLLEVDRTTVADGGELVLRTGRRVAFGQQFDVQTGGELEVVVAVPELD